MSSQDTTLLLYPVMSKMQISRFSLFKHFPIKVNDVTIKSNQNPKIELPRRGVNLYFVK